MHLRSLVAVVALLGVACGSGSDSESPTEAASSHSSAPTATSRASTSTTGPLSGSSSTTGPTTLPSSTAPPTTAAASPALALLSTLPVKGRAPKTGYDRDQFGPAWADVDRNGCDTRNDILNRDLTARTWRPETHGCVVITGTLAEPYTGRTVTFLKERAFEVHVDHVVALSDAWQKGARQLTAEQRRAFANDPLNLLAVDGPTNQSKSDSDAASWLPPNKPYRCAYVARQVAVKARYRLWTTRAEHDTIARILATCPGQGLPGASG